MGGLRSTFRDWASEAAKAPRQVAEMCLAHIVGNTLRGPNGTLRPILDIQIKDQPLTAYNLSVENLHTFFVTGHEAESSIWVHNTCDVSRLYDRPEVETYNGNAVKDTNATDDWDEFLGAEQTNIDPRGGMVDPDRIWSKDGARSIRYGDHEMGNLPDGSTAKESKHHYHRETWKDDQVENDLQRVQRTGSRGNK